MSLDDTLRRLERTLVTEGGILWRNAILGGEPADVAWPDDLPPLTEELRTWFSWRPAATESSVTTVDSYRSAPWAVAAYRTCAEDPRFVRALVPFLDGQFLHVEDDSIWVRAIDDDGLDTFVRTELRGLASVLGPLEADHAARRSSPWRRWRIEATDEAWETLAKVPELAGPVGSAVMVVPGSGKWPRGEVVVRIGASRWIHRTVRVRLPFDQESATNQTLVAFRYAFADGDFSLDDTLTNQQAAERLAEVCRRSKEAPILRRGTLRVWEQPSMDQLLGRLLGALGSTAPLVRASLAPPATANDLAALERDIGRPLPADLRALWMLADGQRSLDPLYWGFVLSGVEEARHRRRSLLDLAANQFGEAYWDTACVPFLDRGNGDALAVDVAGAYGPEGCVVDFDHEQPDRREIQYGSVQEWLECFVDGLESGIYIVNPEGGIFPRDFIEEGSFFEIREHDGVRTNGRYPWERRLRLRPDA